MSSQNDVYKFSHITEEEGLSQNSVIALHQDKLGQIWIGTRDGLNKYDGEEFTVYKHRKDTPNSISNNSILSITEDEEGNIWVGTSYGLNRYNPRTNKFKSYFINQRRNFVGSNMISVIKQLQDKSLWIGSANGISLYNKTTDSFTNILKNQNITSILETSNGTIYVGTNKGLLKLANIKNESYHFESVEVSKGVYIQDIIEGDSGNVLIGTRSKGVLEYNVSSGSLDSYLNKNVLQGKSKNIRKMLIDDNGALWLATYHGLLIATSKDDLLSFYRNDNDEKSINDNFIKSLFKDKMGAVWVGTYYGGVNIWSSLHNNFINITQKSSKAGLSFQAVSSIKKYKDLLIFGTEGGGISILNQKTNTARYLNTQNSEKLKGDNIKALHVKNNGQLWIGTFTNGVAIYNLNTNTFETLPFPEELSKKLSVIGVLSILGYNEDIMFLGTTSRGLIKYYLKTNTYKVFSQFSDEQSITSNYIKSLYKDSKGIVWVGTLRGLNSITNTHKVTKYLYNTDLKVKFEIGTITEDSEGVLWIGTSEDGLFKFENETFIPVKVKVGNATVDGIKSIVNAENDKFWISTYTQGVLKYNSKSNTVEKHYSKKQGIASNQFNRGASLKVNDSQYYFGGPAGVIFFNEANFKKNTYSPQVILTDFKINNTSVSINRYETVLKNTITYTDALELDYNQGNFSLSFAIPNFINSNNNSYQYRLKGVDADWITSTTNSVSYTIQNPGRYTFEVKGINSDGVVNSVPTTLQIKVNPAPWFTWWAYTIYILLILAALYYLYQILESKTQLKHQLELEHLEAEQVKKISQHKLEFFTNISHEFRTPLSLILGPLQQILENYKGSSKMHKKLKMMQNNGATLLQLINSLMDFRKYERNQMPLSVAEGNIVEVLQKVYQSFSDYAESEGYAYNFRTSSPDIRLYFDAKKLESVFFNLISNAFKYTPTQGEITVKLKEENDRVLLTVEDNGVGIPEEYKDSIFERFFEFSTNATDNELKKGTGIGLAIVKNIVDLHKGKISACANTEGKGSIFKVELLKGQSHFDTKDIIETPHVLEEDINVYKNQLQTSETPVVENLTVKLPSKDKMSILLVEDNDELRAFMRDVLMDTYNIFEAENGKLGYKTALKESIDLIVSDVVMPITTGIELCALIKQDVKTSHIPVILLTAKSALTHKIEGLQSGANDYITKPFDIQEFKLRINNILQSIEKLRTKRNTHPVFNAEAVEISSLDDTLYKKALDIIEQNMDNYDFDIVAFCDALGVSKSVLFTKVKAWTNTSPKQFIHNVRLNRAAQMLEKGKLNINTLSAKVGFRDQRYFSRSFKAKFGKTPSAYAKYFTEF